MDAITQMTIVQFGRPFAETSSSSAPHVEVVPEEFRSAPGPVSIVNHITAFEAIMSGPSWFLSEQWQVGEREAQDDITTGRGVFYENSDAFLESF